MPGHSLTVGTTLVEKRGEHSVGVHKRFPPEAGRTINCRAGMGLFLTSGSESIPVEWSLLMDEAWCGDEVRRRRARVPDTVRAAPAWARVLDLTDRLAALKVSGPAPLTVDRHCAIDATHLAAHLHPRERDFVLEVRPDQPVLPTLHTAPGIGTRPGPAGQRAAAHARGTRAPSVRHRRRTGRPDATRPGVLRAGPAARQLSGRAQHPARPPADRRAVPGGAAPGPVLDHQSRGPPDGRGALAAAEALADPCSRAAPGGRLRAPRLRGALLPRLAPPHDDVVRRLPLPQPPARRATARPPVTRRGRGRPGSAPAGPGRTNPRPQRRATQGRTMTAHGPHRRGAPARRSTGTGGGVRPGARATLRAGRPGLPAPPLHAGTAPDPQPRGRGRLRVPGAGPPAGPRSAVREPCTR
ncbi:transposase [Streptomyces violascens]|uniref:transposase n=1 Tax=Streptomyces violascens TaxID=67381 RepID=UPI00366879A7